MLFKKLITHSHRSSQTSIGLTFTSSETTSTFSIDDIDVEGASIVSFSGSGTDYVVRISPTNVGTANIRVLANKFTDTAGLPNEISNTFVWNYDITAPTMTVESELFTSGSSSSSRVTNESPIFLHFTPDETIFDFESSDIIVTGGTLEELTGSGQDWVAEISCDDDGLKFIRVEAASFRDEAGNTNENEITYEWTYDNTHPTMTISTDQFSSNDYSNADTVTLNFTSSESTNDFDESDVICEGGVLSDFSGSGKTYTGTFTPTGGDGEKVVRVRSGCFHDAAGNGNMNADENSGGGWVLIFRHDSRLGMFSNDDDWAEAKRINPDNTHPDDGKFSILDELETLGNVNGKYTLKLQYPENDNQPYYIWSQNCNPIVNTCDGTESDFGFSSIEKQGTWTIGHGGFAGLLTSGSSTYLDGNVGSNWWYAVRNLISPLFSLSLYIVALRGQPYSLTNNRLAQGQIIVEHPRYLELLATLTLQSFTS